MFGENGGVVGYAGAGGELDQSDVGVDGNGLGGSHILQQRGGGGRGRHDDG